MRRSITCGKGRLQVVLDVFDTAGNGLSCFISGGTRPHVGGVALASPGAVLEGKALSHCDLWVSTVPGHKDAEVASAVARKLCLATGECVSVTAGIHVDDATPDEIQALSDGCMDAVEAFLAQYSDGRR